MIIDNKIDSLPPVVRIMSIVPTGLAGLFIYGGVWMLGVPLLLLVLMALTAQQRVTVDFDNKWIRNYYRILWIDFGKWKQLKEFSMISLTPESTVYRETNYSWIPDYMATKSYAFKNSTTMLNLKVNNREKYIVAKGGFNRMFQMAQEISSKYKKDIFDCTVPDPFLIKFQENKLRV